MNAKQKRTMGILLGLVVALLAVLLAVSLLHREETETEDPGSAQGSVSAETLATYSAITYYNGSTTLSFALGEDGVWYWADDLDFPLDNNYLIRLVGILEDLHPVQTITTGDTLESYGLDEPSMTLTATHTDGTQVLYELGDATPTDASRAYLLIDRDETHIHIVDQTLPNQLQGAIYSMMLLPELPMLTEDVISSVTIAGTVTTVLTPQAAAEEEDASDLAFTWVDGQGRDVSESTDLASLQAELAALSVTACKDFKPSDKAVSICGFDSPALTLTVEYTDATGLDASLLVEVGTASLDGDGYYLRMNDDTTIYAIAQEQVDTLLQVAAEGLAL